MTGTLPGGPIGRERELLRLKACLDAGEPALVLLSGVAASGRTTVLEELIRRADGWVVAGGPHPLCEVGEETTPESLLALVESAPQGATLLLLDRFSPSPALVDWLRSTADGGLRRGSEPVVVVVAGSPGELRLLEPLATLHVALGPLQLDAVEAVVREAAADASPPLGREELSALATAAARRPEILASLIRLLPYLGVRASHGTPPPRGT